MEDIKAQEDFKYALAKKKPAHMRTPEDWVWINYYEKDLVKKTLKEK